MKTGAGASLGIAIAMCLGAAGAIRAETRMEKELRLEPGGTFTLKTELGWVKVKGTNRPGARIVVMRAPPSGYVRSAAHAQSATSNVTSTGRARFIGAPD